MRTVKVHLMKAAAAYPLLVVVILTACTGIALEIASFTPAARWLVSTLAAGMVL